jgi:uncharacterized spore protein YtfJ
MKLDEFLTTARESISAKRVYAEPHEVDGVTVIAAASVTGGGGGGGGHDNEGQEGEGGGFGLRGRPTGAYVIKDGQVQWVPAVDVNRIFFGVCAVVIAFLLTRGRTERTRVRSASRRSRSGRRRGPIGAAWPRSIAGRRSRSR